MPDWLYFGDFDLVSKQIEMAGARSKCFGDFDARIEMDRNGSKWIEIDRNEPTYETIRMSSRELKKLQHKLAP
jgi:hypothetical protein